MRGPGSKLERAFALLFFCLAAVYTYKYVRRTCVGRTSDDLSPGFAVPFCTIGAPTTIKIGLSQNARKVAYEGCIRRMVWMRCGGGQCIILLSLVLTPHHLHYPSRHPTPLLLLLLLLVRYASTPHRMNLLHTHGRAPIVASWWTSAFDTFD